MSVISTNTRVFLLKFQQSTEKLICSNIDELASTIEKEMDNHNMYVDYVKCFNNETLSFKRVTKKSLKMFACEDEEVLGIFNRSKII